MAGAYKPSRMSVVGSGVFHEDLEGIVGNLELSEGSKYSVVEEQALYVGG